MSVMGEVLGAFKRAIDNHNAENSGHTAHGIGMAHFDMERLGLEDGETVLPGITIQTDGGTTGNFRVLCDGQHDHQEEEEAQEPVKAVSDPNPTRSDPVYA
jgi:hypothetical protein